MNTTTNDLPTTTASRLEEIASDIQMRMRRTIEDIIHIGKGLLEAKDQLGYSQFGKWCDIQFPDMNRETRSKFMQVAERFGNVRISDNLSPSVYQLLASPSVPDKVVSEIITRSDLGEKVTTGTVRELFKQRRIAPSNDVQNLETPQDQERHPLAVLDELVIKLLINGMTVEDIEAAIYRTDSRISWLKPEQQPESAAAATPKSPDEILKRGKMAWKLIKMTETVGVTASDLHHSGFSSEAVYSCLSALAKDVEREKAGIQPSLTQLPSDLINYESDTVPSRKSLDAFKNKILISFEPFESGEIQSNDDVFKCLIDVINIVREEVGLPMLSWK